MCAQFPQYWVDSNLDSCDLQYLCVGCCTHCAHKQHLFTLIPRPQVAARKSVLSIMEGNTAAPRQLASLFDEWMHLIGEEAEAAVRAFAAREPEATLEEVGGCECLV